jgi:hypothetical protein
MRASVDCYKAVGSHHCTKAVGCCHCNTAVGGHRLVILQPFTSNSLVHVLAPRGFADEHCFVIKGGLRRYGSLAPFELVPRPRNNRISSHAFATIGFHLLCEASCEGVCLGVSIDDSFQGGAKADNRGLGVSFHNWFTSLLRKGTKGAKSATCTFERWAAACSWDQSARPSGR